MQCNGLGTVASILSLKRFEKRYMEISYDSSL